MRRFLTIITILFIAVPAMAQNPKFDKLEMNFAQGHYKRVYRKANRLLDNPEYDYSLLPSYYKSISMFQLAQNQFWLRRNPNALNEAREMFMKVRTSEGGEKLFNAHMYEISWLQNDMTSWAADLRRMGKKEEFDEAQALISAIFNDVPYVDAGNTATVTDDNQSSENSLPENAELRDKIIFSAKEHLGVPYVWAGSSPDGFDCSGFTLYVMKEHGKNLPRRAADQYESSTKLKEKDVQKGDLVFFNNGSGISHVGLVVSEKGEPVKMIHSASSKGIIITEIEKSTYWLKRLHGYGTYLR